MGFILGCFFGAFIGIVIMCLLYMAREPHEAANGNETDRAD
jgi:hypothetical protein